MIPARGMERGAGEIFHARDVGKSRMMQHAGGGDDEIGRFLDAVCGAQMPPAIAPPTGDLSSNAPLLLLNARKLPARSPVKVTPPAVVRRRRSRSSRLLYFAAVPERIRDSCGTGRDGSLTIAADRTEGRSVRSSGTIN